MKINVILFPPVKRTDSAVQIFDFYYAYRQYLNQQSSYKSDTEIVITEGGDIDPTAINIAWYYMPDSLESVDKFDLILIDNNQHHLEVCTNAMYEAINLYPNCYFTSGAFLDKTHPYYEKIIPTPMIHVNRNYFTCPFYPQYHEKEIKHVGNKKSLFYINGQNRPHRKYLSDLIDEIAGSKIDQYKNNYKQTTKLIDCFFETTEDQIFRDFVNDRQATENNWEQVEQDYYKQSVPVGIDSSHGSIPPGYFLLDQYFQYHCVVFPETPWINDEIFVTEKIIKCFVSKSIPFPVGGANTNYLYNQLGYQTAWNLLPDMLQSFDREKNHAKRYQEAVQAMVWLTDNPSVLESPEAEKIKSSNHHNFFTQNDDIYCIRKLDELIEKIKNEC